MPIISDRPPRRARHLIPRDTPRRAEILAGITITLLLVSVLSVPLTAVLAAAFHIVSKVTRWRPVWLACPAAAGLVWVLAAGPGPALAGFGAVPGAVVALLSHAATDPRAGSRLGLLPAIISRGMAPEVPVALVLAPGLAAIAWWLDWLHTNEWDIAIPRPGLVSLCRRRLTVAMVRAGGVVTRDGACLGADRGNGSPVNLAWRDAAGGVLVTGTSWAEVAGSSLQLVHAAIRRRSPVVVLDLSAGSQLPAALADICGAADAPFQVFGPGGPGCYDPFRDHDPATAAGLVPAMIGQAGAEDSVWRAATDCLAAVFRAMSAVPGEPHGAALDEVISLLRPAACLAAIERIPGFLPDRAALAEGLRAAGHWLEADHATSSLIVHQLLGLRASPLGHWLIRGPQPESAAEPIGVVEGMRRRGVTLFCLDRVAHGRAAEMIANLVAADVAATRSRMHRDGAAGDCLLWVRPCDGVDPGVLGRLLGWGAGGQFPGPGAGGLFRYPGAGGPQSGCGLTCVLTTTSPEVAGMLAGRVSARVVHRLADQQLAAEIASLTGSRWIPAAWASPAPYGPATDQAGDGTGPAGPGRGGSWISPDASFGVIKAPRVAAERFCRLGAGEFVLITGQGARVVARGQAVTGDVRGLPARASLSGQSAPARRGRRSRPHGTRGWPS